MSHLAWLSLPLPQCECLRGVLVCLGKGWRQALRSFWEVIPALSFSLICISMLNTGHWGLLIFIYCSAFQNVFETINEREYNLGNVTECWLRNLNSVIHLLLLGDIRSSESSFIHKNQMGWLDFIKNCWRVWLFLNAKGKIRPIRICKSTCMHYQFMKGFIVSQFNLFFACENRGRENTN